MKLRNSNLPSEEGKEKRAQSKTRFTARVARGAESAEKKGMKTGEAQKSRSAARPLTNIYQGFLEGPHISETNGIVSDIQDPPIKLLHPP